jgi:hypothetical protein
VVWSEVVVVVVCAITGAAIMAVAKRRNFIAVLQ